jgi:NEDD8-activating enzyme E1 regulatory subunit
MPPERCKNLSFLLFCERHEPYAASSERAPTADLPNTAAFLGGLVAQEVIKMVTKQYIPINGICVIDLIDTWTGIV